MARIYLDWAATAPPDPDMVETAARIARASYGNPSSIHEEGRSAEAVLAESRRRFAHAVGVEAKQIVFTSGGTEANNLVLFSLLAHPSRGEIVASDIEHASVHEPLLFLESCGFRVRRVAAGNDGIVDPARLEAALGPDTLMVVVMHVNNETGAVQPIEELAAVVHRREDEHGRRIHFHCDAVQALGKVAAGYDALGVDSAAFSGHKLGGLRGAGALYLRRPLPALYRGGGQEAGMRPGTENLPAIWSLSEAAVRACESLERHREDAVSLKRRLVSGVEQIEGARFVPMRAEEDEERYSPFILSVAFPPLPGEVLVRVLNDAGVAVSMGSACSARQTKERRVLSGMGVDAETARSAIRISTGYATTSDEVDRFLETLQKEVHRWSTPLRA